MQTKNIYFGIMAALALTACNGDDNAPAGNVGGDGERVALQVTSGIETRAHDNLWEQGDKIGIHMLDGDKIDTYANCPYLIEGNGTTGRFTPLDATIYFPLGDVTRDFVAYYPFSEDKVDAQNRYTLDLTDQSNQSAIDFMMADKVTGKHRFDPKVNFTFTHKLAQIVMTIAPGNGMTPEELEGLRVGITDQRTSGTYDLIAGTAFSHASDATLSEIALTVTQDGTSAKGMVFPCDRYGEMRLHFVTRNPESHYYWQLTGSTADKFEAGKRYTYNIKLHKTDAEVSATITDWVDGNGTDGEDANIQ